jgi:hypothetical protein
MRFPHFYSNRFGHIPAERIDQSVDAINYIPGVGQVFSVRKANIYYDGPCMRVRRSSDNALQDIYFSGIDLDTVALLSFIGANSGFVETWYNQTSLTNIVQTTAGFQPRIVNAGVVETRNGRPSLRFYNGQQRFPYNTSLSTAAGLFSSVVSIDNTAGNSNNIYYSDGAGFQGSGVYCQVGGMSFNSSGVANAFYSAISSNTLTALNFHKKDNIIYPYGNSTLATPASLLIPFTQSGSQGNLGRYISSDAFSFIGYISENINASGIIDAPLVESLISEQIAYFSIV